MNRRKAFRWLAVCASAITLPALLIAAEAGKPATPAKPVEPTKKEEPKLPTPKPSLDSWKLEVLLEKPAIHVPSVVETAPDGRIFVAEDPMDQFGPGNKPIDRILCIHPDGKITVFAETLYAVFGMHYIDGKLIVHHSPKMSVFTDDNGVGKDRKDIYDTDNPATWGGGSLNDHIPAQIRLGMDGYLYMSVGDKGVFGLVSNIDKSTAQLKGGGVIRFRPDGTQFETYATGTRNHLDISMNSEDEIFSYDNTDDGLGWNTRFTHLVDGGFYGYPYEYRPQETDAEGLARMKSAREEMAKVRAEYDKKIKEAKTDEEKAAIPKPSPLAPAFRPYTLWAMDDFGGGSPCGAIGYNEDALPEEYRGNLFHCEWGKGSFERFVVERIGATYKVVKRDDKFLKGGTQPFRPLGVCVTPDGMGFYIADWNFAGWNNKTDAGRLMKLTYTGKSMAAPKPAWFVPAAMGKKFEATTADLIAGLSHPAQSVRQVAQRRVAERGDEAVAPLIALINNTAAPAHGRWAAIWTLDRLQEGKAGREAIVGLVKNTTNDVTVRRQAARQLGQRKAAEGITALVAAMDDTDAAMRFRAATALGRIGDASAVPALINKLTEPDLFARFAVFTALNRIGKASPNSWEMMVKAISSDQERIRDGATFAMREVYDTTLVNGLAAYVTQATNPAPGRVAAVNAIAPMFKQQKPWEGKWWGTQPQRSNPPAREVEWAGTSMVQDAIRKALDDGDAAVRLAAIKALQIAPDPAAGERLAAIFKSETDNKARKAVLRSLTVGKSPAAGALALEVLKNAKANPELVPDAMTLAVAIGGQPTIDALGAMLSAELPVDTLVSAADALGKTKNAAAIPALVKATESKETRVVIAAILAMGNVPGDATLKALLPLVDKSRKVDVRRSAIVAIGTLKTSKAIEPLLPMYRDAEVGKDVIATLAVTPKIAALDAYLDGLGSSDGTLRSNCRKAIQNFQKEALPLIEAGMDTNPLPAVAINELQQLYSKTVPEDQRKSKLWSYDTKKLSPEAFANYAKSHKGDVNNGKKIFANANGAACIKCHKVGSAGTDVGPALDGVGAKYDRTFLVETVLYPSKQILDGYHQTIVRMTDGDVQSGVLKGETATEITLYDGAGQKLVIKKSEIKSREHGKLSVMPEGLQTALKPEEFADLVAYLESLKDQPKK